jgi:hypothetical protein
LGKALGLLEIDKLGQIDNSGTVGTEKLEKAGGIWQI